MAGKESTIGALLDETSGSIKTGPFGTKLKASEYTATGVPVISVGEVGFGRLRIHADTPRVDETVSSRMPEFLLKAGDIVFGRKGAVERSAQVQADEDGYFLGSDGIRIRLNIKSCDPKYIAYQLQTAAHRSWMIQHAAGTTMPSLNEGIIRRIPIVLKPLAEQKAIAGVLGALDDKIELNRRMNGTLEALARALFQSWFVDFDPVRAKLDGRLPANLDPVTTALFPDSFEHCNGKLIPAGWQIKSISDVTERVTKGDTPRNSAMEAASADEPLVRMLRVNAITELGEILYDKLEYIPESIHLGKSRRSILQANDILYTNAGTIGRVAFVQRDLLPANTNQAIAIVRADATKVPPAFLFMLMRQQEFKEILHYDIVQAVQANLALGKISVAKAVFPPSEVLPGLFAPIECLLNRIWTNRRESRTLATLRDTLLPKLLSGELSVAEIQVARGAAENAENSR